MSRALTVVLVRLEGWHYVPLEQSAANRLFSADALGAPRWIAFGHTNSHSTRSWRQLPEIADN
jgi:hypothetical protein